VATGKLKYIFPSYPSGKDVIFSKDIGLCEITEHKEFKFKCVNVTLSKTRKSLKLLQNVLPKEAYFNYLPISKKSLMICSA